MFEEGGILMHDDRVDEMGAHGPETDPALAEGLWCAPVGAPVPHDAGLARRFPGKGPDVRTMRYESAMTRMGTRTSATAPIRRARRRRERRPNQAVVLPSIVR